MSNISQSKTALYWDGAMGTELWRQHPDTANLIELVRWPLTHAPWVQAVHQQYVAAGAQGITTHSFCANRAYLSQYGWADETSTINLNAALLARQSLQDAQQKIWIAGSIGPLSATLGESEQAEIYQEQVLALLQGGVDLLLLETHQQLATALAAIQAAHQAMKQAHQDVPVIVSFSLDKDTRLTDGSDLSTLCYTLVDHSIDGLGLNCCQGPTSLVQATPILTEYSCWPLWIRPSAGLPQQAPDGRLSYPFAPAEFASILQPLIAQNPLAVIGGCCGTTPDHIQALATCGTP